MPFSKGDSRINRAGRPKSDQRKTIWLLQSLQEHGYDYEAMLVKFLDKAAKGDRHALDMAHLLVKLVPHLANAPKSDVTMASIDTLVINRFDSRKQESIETTAVDSPVNDVPLNNPSQSPES